MHEKTPDTLSPMRLAAPYIGLAVALGVSSIVATVQLESQGSAAIKLFDILGSAWWLVPTFGGYALGLAIAVYHRTQRCSELSRHARRAADIALGLLATAHIPIQWLLIIPGSGPNIGLGLLMLGWMAVSPFIAIVVMWVVVLLLRPRP
jgi:hypothetical protein